MNTETITKPKFTFGDELHWCRTCKDLVNENWEHEGNGNTGTYCERCGTATMTLGRETRLKNVEVEQALKANGYSLRRFLRCANYDYRTAYNHEAVKRMPYPYDGENRCGKWIGGLAPEEYPAECPHCGCKYWHFDDVSDRERVIYRFD